MIAAISWVPKGVAKSVPAVAEPPSKEEIEEILKSGAFERSEESENEDHDEDMDADAANQGDEVAHALAAADALGKGSKSTSSKSNFEDITDGLRELDMEHYDEEDNGVELFGVGLGDTYYPSNDMDPYLKDKDDDDSSEELEDITIKAEDAVLVCARNEDDVSHLEVWIYEDPADGDSNMYVHHDIIIPAFPLCTAWLDCPIKGGEKGNFIAVGSMEPSIEIWDLDIMDEVQPLVVLGGVAEKKKKKKGRKNSIKYKEDSHTDAVLGLAWNREYRNIIASASADKLVKIWDVATRKCDITMAHHTDKVQAIAWNHHVPQVLLSGSFDHTVVTKDGRIPSHTGFKWSVSADVESVAWDPHSEHSFVVSLEDGTVNGYDIRAATSDQSLGSKPSFTLHAHDKAVCSISYNPLAPNLLATGSTDKMVKLWDLSNNEPSCVASTNPKAGAVFSISFSQDNPFLLAIGGSKGRLEVWDTLSDAGVSRRYGHYGHLNRS
ncbi:uncharacterized protein LOC130751868 [Actinidia eriantha]|uniref:uncharacterized protein LOC130751868 n=1 Tax=Actinidia eriantha TaxID=165200 RepID=UPI00258CDA2B|nr:uncharacterized protein LOC130751868 [Actinidia eriantha]XP_057461569.1 uncharacterized protein LOC130751868 [Actinidia eriantha]